MKPLALIIVTAAFAPQLAHADMNIAKTDKSELNVGAMSQVLGFGQQLDDPFKDHNRLFLFMKEMRLRANGNYEDFSFNIEMALGGEEAIAAQTGVSLSLLDVSVNVPLFAGAYLKVGQFKVPYGRERLTYSRDSQFLDRSIQDLGFRVGRDVGVALTVNPGKLLFTAGVFTGGGRDVPPNRYLPEQLGIPEIVVRAGYGDVDDDAYAMKNLAQSKETKWGVFANALYTKDSLVGHSTVLNVKLADKSLLLNSNWNPYIGQAPFDQSTWWQTGADAALRTPLSSDVSLSAEVEFNWAGFQNKYGQLHIAGGRVQAGLGFSKFEAAVRYAVLFPDKYFASGGKPITGTDPMHEITPSFTYYVSGQRLKLVADVPILLATPVVTENKVGAYVGMELPDQTAGMAKGATVARQNVIEARLMLQAAF